MRTVSASLALLAQAAPRPAAVGGFVDAAARAPAFARIAAGKRFEDIETDLALDYQKHDPNTALPWDRARPAVKSAWQRVSGTITPRDTDRGVRGSP